MSADAIFELTEALRGRLEGAVGAGQVHVGPPVPDNVGNRRVSLFLFHLEPNRELRNTSYFADGAGGGPGALLDEQRALPLDLRFLISVFRQPDNGPLTDPNELGTLGQVIAVLHRTPSIAGPALPDQDVRITPEPFPMEELSRVWGLFPEASFRTSVVYLASPLYVADGPTVVGAPVTDAELRTAASTDPPDLFGRRRTVEVP